MYFSKDSWFVIFVLQTGAASVASTDRIIDSLMSVTDDYIHGSEQNSLYESLHPD